MVVVVVGIEEEMEEKKMVELVVEMEGRGGAWLAKGGSKMALWLLPFAGNKEGEEEIMKERERNGVYI